jgi:hypothetical protein
MGQELLNVNLNWTRQPRTYYLATTSNGMKFVRGSATNCYTHAVVCSKAPHFGSNQIETYGWCHGREDLAKRNFNRLKKFGVEQNSDYEYELVELIQITAKEVREIKKQAKKQRQEWEATTLSKLLNRNADKEQENTNDNTI